MIAIKSFLQLQILPLFVRQLGFKRVRSWKLLTKMGFQPIIVF
jgi:hypothetical protein